MTGGFSWECILEYVCSYWPLDSGVCSACAGLAGTGFALSALLSGYSTAKHGYLGYLVLFIQKQGQLGLRASVISANLQKGLGALFGLFLVYVAKFRVGFARMTLYTYATFISGSQLLWGSRPSKGRYHRLGLAAQLSMLGAGYAGERSTSYIFKAQLKKAWQNPRTDTVTNGRQTKTDDSDSDQESNCEGGPNGTMTRPGCTCCHPDDRLGGCIGPAATARESCVCFVLGEQYNWKPHVCPILKEGAREGLCTCCYPELSCPERDNRGNSSVKDQTEKQVKNGPEGTKKEKDCVPRKPQPKMARKIRNLIRKKLFAAKLPGIMLGTALAAWVSTGIFIKISTVVTMISYNFFFWMGAQSYDLGELENYDTMDENELGEMEEHDKKDEGKTDGKCGKQIPVALVPEVKKALKVVLELLLLWPTFASTCYLVNATAESLFMEQVDYLERNTECLKIPRSVFSSFPDIVSNITGQVSYYLVELFDDEKKEARWARLFRISIGMLFSSLCCIVASLVAHRLDSNYNSASMLWLLPQFLLLGMMRGILEEGLEEFLHDHIDNDSMVQDVIGFAESMGSFISSILVAASPSSWVDSGTDISKSHVDNYYRMLAIITLFSTFFFTIVAIAYELPEKEDTE